MVCGIHERPLHEWERVLRSGSGSKGAFFSAGVLHWCQDFITLGICDSSAWLVAAGLTHARPNNPLRPKSLDDSEAGLGCVPVDAHPVSTSRLMQAEVFLALQRCQGTVSCCHT